MAADERSEQHVDQMDNIEEFNDHLDMIPPPLAQDLSIVQVNINGKYNIEKFIDLVKEEPCLWNTAFRSYKDQTKKKNAWSNISSKMGKDSK